MSIGPGSRLSHYEILDEISRGGMGVVYRARDLSLHRDVEIIGTERVRQILAEMNGGDDRTLPFDLVQRLAQRAGVGTVLVGSYVKAGEAIRINVRLQNPLDGRILSAERVDAVDEADLFRRWTS